MTPQPTLLRHRRSPSRQRGASLLVTLALVAGVLIIAVMSVGGNISSERGSANARDADIAHQGAEAALRAGEAAARSLAGSSDGAADCSSAKAGVCYLKDNNYRLSAAAWQGLTIAQAANCPRSECATPSTPSILDASPATSLADGFISGVSRQPSYIIEVLPAAVAGEEAQSVVWMYRITAKGWGKSSATQVVLQSVYYPLNG